MLSSWFWGFIVYNCVPEEMWGLWNQKERVIYPAYSPSLLRKGSVIGYLNLTSSLEGREEADKGKF